MAPAAGSGGAGAAAGRRGRRGRRCPDCGAAMLYYPHLSSPRAPDGRRALVYSCPECTDDFERPRMVVVRPGAGGAGVDSVGVEIVERARGPPQPPPPAGAGSRK